MDHAAYREGELTRSAVERQPIVIGEAVDALLRLEPLFAARICRARPIVGFRDQLRHDYAAVNHAVVWAIATGEAPVLRADSVSALV